MGLAAYISMRQYHINGGPGVLVSGIVWLTAAIVTHFVGFQVGMLSLFVGGMLIVPVSGVIERQMRDRVAEPDKGLTRLALFTLPLLFGGLFLGYAMSSQEASLFFEIVAIAIGVRYLVFSRVYGLNTFILLGILLIATGTIASLTPLYLAYVPLAVGLIEVVIGGFLTRREPN